MNLMALTLYKSISPMLESICKTEGRGEVFGLVRCCLRYWDSISECLIQIPSLLLIQLPAHVNLEEAADDCLCIWSQSQKRKTRISSGFLALACPSPGLCSLSESEPADGTSLALGLTLSVSAFQTEQKYINQNF